MSRVQINPQLIAWAADQAGVGLDYFAQKLSSRDADKIKDGSLSEAQVRRAAELAKVKLYHLFLDTPPSLPKLPLADFRTLRAAESLSKDFYDVYYDVEYKQKWFKDYLLREGAEPLPFVGKFSKVTDYKIIAADIREALSIQSKPTSIRRPEAYYSFLVEKAEALRILVFKNGVVGNNTSRALSVSEFRGFTVADPIAPVIFINGKDAPAAWVFTLIHELAHIWRGESAISDAASNSSRSEEIICNKIAAEVLVPEVDFRHIWENSKGNVEAKLLAAQLYFVVSSLVIARRALDLGFINQATYNKKAQSFSEPTASGSGGNFYSSLNIRNSKTLTKIVTDLAVTGALSFKEAGKLLQISPVNVVTVYKKNNADAISS